MKSLLDVFYSSFHISNRISSIYQLSVPFSNHGPQLPFLAFDVSLYLFEISLDLIYPAHCIIFRKNDMRWPFRRNQNVNLLTTNVYCEKSSSGLSKSGCERTDD